MHRATTGSTLAFLTAAGMVLMAFKPVPTRSAPITGDWGGPQVRFQLSDTGGQLDLACASAMIETPVRLDSSGKFSAHGHYEDFAAGPTAADTPPRRAPAHFTGHVEGNVMHLSMQREGQQTVEVFTLEHGRRVKLIRCA